MNANTLIKHPPLLGLNNENVIGNGSELMEESNLQYQSDVLLN